MSHDAAQNQRRVEEANYPWSISTFRAFAAVGGVLLDLVIGDRVGIDRSQASDTLDHSFNGMTGKDNEKETIWHYIS